MAWALRAGATEPVLTEGPTRLTTVDGLVFVSWAGIYRDLHAGGIEALDVANRTLRWSLATPALATNAPRMIGGLLHTPLFTRAGNTVQLLNPATGALHGEVRTQGIACANAQWWISAEGAAFRAGQTTPAGELPHPAGHCVITGNLACLLEAPDATRPGARLHTFDLQAMQARRSYALPTHFVSEPRGQVGDYWRLAAVRDGIAYLMGSAGRTRVQAYDLEQGRALWDFSMAGADPLMHWRDDSTLVVQARAIGSAGWGSYRIDAKTGQATPDYGKGSAQALATRLRDSPVLYGTVIAQLTQHAGYFRSFAQNDAWLVVITDSGELAAVDLLSWRLVWKKSLARDFAEPVKDVAALALADGAVVLASHAGYRLYVIELHNGAFHRLQSARAVSRQ